MSNIKKIIKDDFRLIMSNVISIVVVIGLIVVPGMYVWFNLAGMWDPYNNVDNLEVAIVNDDVGYESQLIPMDLKLGSSVVSALHENQGLKWVFTDYDEAMNNLLSAKYYAVIVIPQDFSKQLLSIISGNVKSANLLYYSNEKSNPIAPKITDKGASAIQQNINQTFSNTIYSVLLKTLFNLTNSEMPQESSLLSKNLSAMLLGTGQSINNIKSELSMIKTNIKALCNSLNEIKSNIAVSGSDVAIDLNKTLDEISNRISQAKSSLSSVQEILSIFGIRSSLVDDFVQFLNETEDSIKNCREIIIKSNFASDSFIQTVDSILNLSQDAQTQIDSLFNTLDIIEDDVNNSYKWILSLSTSDSIDQIKTLIGNDSDQLASLLTSPVQLDRTPVFPMANNAASMSGFYISICIWVGSLILAALLEANLGRRRTKKYLNKNLKNWQVYLGRYAIFAVISLCQSIFIALGCLFFLQIPVAYPLRYLLTIALISICYSLFVYTMLASFGSIGKALCVILLVLQIAATGGTFPIQLVIEPFQVISPFLPTTYALKAINMCVAGYVNYDLIKCMLSLCLTMIPVSLMLGLLLKGPISKLNEKFKEKVDKAKLLAI